MTFEQCADAYLRQHSPTWRNDKHRKQWRSTLDHAVSHLGKLDVRTVDTAHIIKLLEPIWESTPETGSRLRGRIEKVLDWATARAYRDGPNPARWKGHLQHLLKARPKAVHHAALPFDDVPAFMKRLRDRDSLSARALELTILTAARTGEVIGAKWDEIDLKAKVWTVPADRMKSHREHRVQLRATATPSTASAPPSLIGHTSAPTIRETSSKWRWPTPSRTGPRPRIAAAMLSISGADS
jgi:integrase